MPRASSIAALPRREQTSPENFLSSSLRKNGIRAIADMPWGTHICVFYETKEDLLDTAVCYFAAGLRNNEYCLWAVTGLVTERDAREALRAGISDFARYEAAGAIEIIDGNAWYLDRGRFSLKRIIDGWRGKLRGALGQGYEGMRVSGNAFWVATHHWKSFIEYEHELDALLIGQKLIVLCTYPLKASRATDVLDVVRAHQRSVARRNGRWELLETPELTEVKREIEKLNDGLDALSKPFPGHETLTPRECATLAHVLRGFSSKEAARALGISPRTVEFHRANLLKKLHARNTADLVRKLLAG